MSIQEGKQEESIKVLCVSCQTFYGSEAFNKMCSKCFKESQGSVNSTSKKEEAKQPPTSTELPPVSEKKIEIASEMKQEKPEEQKEEKKEVNKDKCYACSRKLKLLGTQCRCGYFYCNSHRLPETHTCTYDHKAASNQQVKLAKDAIQCKTRKIESI